MQWDVAAKLLTSLICNNQLRESLESCDFYSFLQKHQINFEPTIAKFDVRQSQWAFQAIPNHSKYKLLPVACQLLSHLVECWWLPPPSLCVPSTHWRGGRGGVLVWGLIRGVNSWWIPAHNNEITASLARSHRRLSLHFNCRWIAPLVHPPPPQTPLTFFPPTFSILLQYVHVVHTNRHIEFLPLAIYFPFLRTHNKFKK